MAKQGELLGGTERNPARYRELSQPFESKAEAMDAAQAFVDAVKAARVEHKIPDFVLAFTFPYLDDDGEVNEAAIAQNMGDGMKAEGIAAFAFGRMQAQREDAVAHALKIARR